MIDKFLNFLQNRFLVLIIMFIGFVIFLLIILNSFYPDKIPFKTEYLYLVYFLVFYLDLYLILYIWKTKDFILDSRYLFLIALNLLIFTPFYIILKQQKIAEQLSVYAYYAMVAWVVFEIIINILLNKFKKNEQ